MLLHRGLLCNRTCSAVGIVQKGQKMQWKQQRGYSASVFSRHSRHLDLNCDRHRPPDSNRIRTMQTLTSITWSRYKETTLVPCDRLALL